MKLLIVDYPSSARLSRLVSVQWNAVGPKCCLIMLEKLPVQGRLSWLTVALPKRLQPAAKTYGCGKEWLCRISPSQNALQSALMASLLPVNLLPAYPFYRNVRIPWTTEPMIPRSLPVLVSAS